MLQTHLAHYPLLFKTQPLLFETQSLLFATQSLLFATQRASRTPLVA